MVQKSCTKLISSLSLTRVLAPSQVLHDFFHPTVSPNLPFLQLTFQTWPLLTAQDADQACRLLLSGLALALLDNCQVEELKPGIYAYLATWQEVADIVFGREKIGVNEK